MSFERAQKLTTITIWSIIIGGFILACALDLIVLFVFMLVFVAVALGV